MAQRQGRAVFDSSAVLSHNWSQKDNEPESLIKCEEPKGSQLPLDKKDAIREYVANNAKPTLPKEILANVWRRITAPLNSGLDETRLCLFVEKPPGEAVKKAVHARTIEVESRC
jgi:hypothetical protein